MLTINILSGWVDGWDALSNHKRHMRRVVVVCRISRQSEILRGTSDAVVHSGIVMGSRVNMLKRARVGGMGCN